MAQSANPTRKLTREEAGEMFMKYFGFVRAVAFEHAPSKSLVEDITHDAYVCFAEKAETWDFDEAKIEALLRSITEKMAHRAWKVYLRNQPEHLRELAEFLKLSPDDGTNFRGTYDQLDDKLAILEGCLAKLPEDQRAIIEAVYLSDKGYTEVIKMLGKSPNAVYQQVSRIRAFLEECVETMLKLEIKS
ncbi:MAG: sigma-70 family RNA polymerase sigma factor [Planctomycetia bacterium]|nr:sigma-70 family RNA polymerase sigma factor [Planctomycetia bacterium]